ncbi:MAG: Uma2 family endonuclease, partial [Bacteroidota bacterium]
MIKTELKQSKLSLDAFLDHYSDLDDGLKYEFNNGIVEVRKQVDQQSLCLQRTLLHLFIQTMIYKKGGILTFSTDMFTSTNKLRRPDLA